MIREWKKAFSLYPHLYQAKQQTAFLALFLLMGIINIRGNGAGLDLSIAVFLWAAYAGIPPSVFLRMEYASLMATSPMRKRILFRIVPVLNGLLLILFWCLLVAVAYLTGRSDDLKGASAVVMMLLYAGFAFFTIWISVLSSRFNRVVSIALLLVLTAVLGFVLSFISRSGMQLPALLENAAIGAYLSVITPPVTILIVSLVAVLLALMMRLLLKLIWKRPVRREYLERLRG